MNKMQVTGAVKTRPSVGPAILGICCVITGVAWWAVTDDALMLAGPLVACVAIAAAFFIVLSLRSEGVAPWFELGTVYCGVICVYSIVPLFMQLRRSDALIQVADARFSIEPVEAAEFARVAWLHVAYLLAFAVSYLFWRGRARSRLRWDRRVSPQVVKISVLYLVGALATIQLCGILYDLNGGGYTESYVRIAQLPAFTLYSFSFAQKAVPTLTILLLISLFPAWPRSAWLILLLVAAPLLQAFLSLGSRTDAACILLGALSLYHFTIKPIHTRTAFILGVGALLFFNVLGFLRTQVGGAELIETATLSGGEFECVYNNALDLSRKRTSVSGTEIPLSDYFFADFLQVIPKQFLPIEKFEHSTWYVQTYYPAVADSGGGFAFGAIAEAVISYGIWDVLARASLIGMIMGLIHKVSARRTNTFWQVALYVWVLTFSYQLFRDTSFSLVYQFVHRFLLVYIVVEFASRAFTSAEAFLPVRIQKAS